LRYLFTSVIEHDSQILLLQIDPNFIAIYVLWLDSCTSIVNEAYTYDQNGNRTNSGYVTDAGNRLRSDGTYNYEYDFEGNRTTRTKIADGTVDTYSWDDRNRLMGIVTKNLDGLVTRTVGYTYDVDDQRVSKTVDGVVEHYYLDGEQIAFVTDGGGNETFHYLYGLNVDQVLAQDDATGMLWALADRLGSVDTLTDADGTVVDERTFDSFGRVLSQSNPAVSFRYGYTGRELDTESGLDYYRARYYDAAVGRFISVDPMGFGAGDTNLYRYVGNNSTNATDPTGNFVFVPILLGAIALGGVFGAGYAVANHLEKGGSLNNIDWQDTWEKATIGGAGAAVVTTGAAAIGAGLTAAGVAASTVQAGGLIFGAAGTGWSIGSGINNIANGKPLTGTLDLIGAGLGIKGLVSGYQGYRQTLTNENIARSGIVYDVPGNPRPISQEYPQLNSSGKIVLAGSSTLAEKTSLGSAIVPYSNTGVTLVSANSASSAISQATQYNVGYIPEQPLPQQKIKDQDIPTPSPLAKGRPHTTLGGRDASDGSRYRQSATFPGETWPKAGGQDVPWGRVDWSTHNRPDAHPNPHIHEFTYDCTQKMWVPIDDIKPFY
jgi:RHS repeat-associated protein